MILIMNIALFQAFDFQDEARLEYFLDTLQQAFTRVPYLKVGVTFPDACCNVVRVSLPDQDTVGSEPEEPADTSPMSGTRRLLAGCALVAAGGLALMGLKKLFWS